MNKTRNARNARNAEKRLHTSRGFKCLVMTSHCKRKSKWTKRKWKVISAIFRKAPTINCFKLIGHLQRAYNKGSEALHRKSWKKCPRFFLVCSYVLTHITEMLIHEDMKYAMTNYTQVPKGGKAVDSHHLTTVAK